MKITLDVIVCTYQREDILIDCLESVCSQDYDERLISYNIIVVNNAPDPLSEKITSYLASKQIALIHERHAGLSVARNKGIAFANADWLAFIDDDALAPTNYVSQISEIIKEESWHCFGGHIASWWKYDRPRWLAEDYGSKPIISDRRVILDASHNWGSNIIIKRSCLQEVGGFPDKIGMKGKQLGYAAENIVQDKLRAAGYTIGYDPQLSVDHLVLPQKLKLRWHIKSAYATGRDGKSVYPEQYSFFGYASSVKNCISRPLKAIVGWITSPATHPKSITLDVIRPYAILAGKLTSLFR